MPDEVVVARFDSEAAAMQAANALEGSGVPAAAIRRQTGATAHEPSEQSAGDIWDWLLGEESPVRDKSIWRGGASTTARTPAGLKGDPRSSSEPGRQSRDEPWGTSSHSDTE